MVHERTHSLQRVNSLVRDLGPDVPYAAHLARLHAIEQLADMLRRDPPLQAKGIDLLAAAAELASELAMKDPTTRGFTSAMAYLRLGQAQAEIGNHAEATTNLRYAANALDVLVELTPEEDPDRGPTEHFLASALVSLGDSCQMLEHWEPATTALDRAIALRHRMTEQSPGEPFATWFLIKSLQSKARLLEQVDKLDEATLSLNDALRNAQMLADLTADDEEWAEPAGDLLGVIQGDCGNLSALKGRTDDAIKHYEEALKYWEARHTRHPERPSGALLMQIGSSLTDILIEMGLNDRAQQVREIVQETLDQQEDDKQT